MLLQNYLQASRSLSKLSFLGDIRYLNSNEHILSELLELTGDNDSSADQLYFGALRMFVIFIQGGILPKTSNLAGMRVKDFEIGKYNVTKDEWQFVRNWSLENGYDIDIGDADGIWHPVQYVNWYDCVKWCNARSEMAGLAPVYEANGKIYRSSEYGPHGSNAVTQVASANGYRLPTECEWEWAARGGINTEGYAFAGSNTLDDVGWYNENSEGSVHAVGQKIPNELGLYDMSGNVYEWCWDAEESKQRRMRGGWCHESQEGCKVNCRYKHWPDNRSFAFGFRLARSL